jgi:hypothetical protein
MDSVARNVLDLTPLERHALEDVLGQPLRDEQRVIVQLVNPDGLTPPADSMPLRDNTVTIKREGDVGILPDWCAIFADLSDEEMAELEAAILDRSDSRSFDDV